MVSFVKSKKSLVELFRQNFRLKRILSLFISFVNKISRSKGF